MIDLLFYILIYVLVCFGMTVVLPSVVYLCVKLGTLGYLKAKESFDFLTKENLSDE